MTFIGGLNQFKLSEKEKKQMCINSLQPDHLEAEQNNSRVKRSKN